MLAVLATYYLLLYRQNPASLADTVSAQMLVLLYLLLPVLFLAGTDIAEVGQSAAGLVGRLTHRGRLTWLLPFLTLLVALGALVYALAYLAGGLDRLNGLPTLAPPLLLLLMPGLAAILLLALVAALGRVGGWPRMNVPFSALAVSIVPVLFVVATVTVFYQPGEPFAVYQHSTGQLRYSLAYPATWSPTVLQEGSDSIPTEAVFNGTQDTQLPGAFFVFGSKPVPGATNDLSPSDVDGAAQQVLVPTFSTSAATATIALSESPQQGQWYVRGFTVTYPDQIDTPLGMNPRGFSGYARPHGPR
jgi:hypothetical protein